MSDISVCFNKRDFEYDVYTLIQAFYPGKNISTFYKDESKHPSEAFLKLNVGMYDDRLVLEIFNSKDDADNHRNGAFAEPLRVSRNLKADADRQSRKNILKQMVYESLSSIERRTLPWGTLTGIRPTKIPMRMIEQGVKPPDIAKYMKNIYYASPKKISLAIAVAQREKEILDMTRCREGYSLYIGIPFCPSICLYCSFGSHPYEKWGYLSDDYLKALFKELSYIAYSMKNKSLQSVYVGGGTPTTLSPEQLESLTDFLHENFDFGDVREFTVEAGRPDTVTKEKLDVLSRGFVNRISINPQTMNQKTLDLIGRNHTTKQVEEAFYMARDAGFTNINMDIIVGLPQEGINEIERTMRKIILLNPESLTVHSLALKRATRLNLYKDSYAPVSFDNTQEIMDIIGFGASEMGMDPYYMYRQKNMAGNLENIGYARRGYFGIYNILMMEEKQTIMAAGSGAVTKFVFEDGRIERAENVKDIKNYIDRTEEMIIRKEKVKWS